MQQSNARPGVHIALRLPRPCRRVAYGRGDSQPWETAALADDAFRLRHGLITPKNFTRVLSRRGILFVKVGQFLATRPDLIPQEYCDELLKLTDQMKPFPWSDARRIIEEDLGDKLETHFTWVNRRPIASASLSQVYLARTIDGAEVVIKVRREGVAETAEQQLRNAGWMLRLLELAGALPGVRATDLRREASDWINEELDFHRELSKLTRMYAVFSGDARFRFPRPYPQHSGDRVLVTEYLPGVPFSELLRLVRRGQHARFKQLGFNAGILSRNLIDGLLDQIFRRQMFHGDPHPGNLLAMEGNVIGFVDFGLVQVLDNSVRRRQGEYIEAVYNADPDRIHHALLDVLEPDEGANLERFRTELFDATRAWVREAEIYGAVSGAGRSPIANYMIEVLRTARRNHLHLPQSVLAMYRSILTADSIANALGCPGELSRAGRRFFQRLRIEQVADGAMPDATFAAVLDTLAAASNAPTQLNRLLGELSDGRYVLQVRTSDSVEDRRDMNLRAKLAAASILSVGFTILLAGQMLHRAGPLVVWALFALLLTSYIAVALLWMRLK
jgi:ubiquinone biosynthesis protein